MKSKTNRGLRVINYRSFKSMGATGAATAVLIRQLDGGNMVLTIDPELEEVTV